MRRLPGFIGLVPPPTLDKSENGYSILNPIDTINVYENQIYVKGFAFAPAIVFGIIYYVSFHLELPAASGLY
jgi:hypothetical protein